VGSIWFWIVTRHATRNNANLSQRRRWRWGWCYQESYIHLNLGESFRHSSNSMVARILTRNTKLLRKLHCWLIEAWEFSLACCCCSAFLAKVEISICDFRGRLSGNLIAGSRKLGDTSHPPQSTARHVGHWPKLARLADLRDSEAN